MCLLAGFALRTGGAFTLAAVSNSSRAAGRRLLLAHQSSLSSSQSPPRRCSRLRRRPRVLLLGWSGCRPRHLRRYVDAYSDLGVEAVPRTDHCEPLVAFRRRRLREKAADMLRLLEDGGPFDAVHVFSNGGGVAWSECLSLARERQRQMGSATTATMPTTSIVPSIQIVDSAPGYIYDARRGFLSGYHFLCAFVPKPLAIAVVSAAALPRILWYAASLQWTDHFSRNRRYKESWARDATRLGVRRHLLLYSEDDLLVEAESVREFAGMLRRHGGGGRSGDDDGDDESLVVVREKVWKDSEHVRHLAHHPDEYKAELRGVLSPLLVDAPSEDSNEKIT